MTTIINANGSKWAGEAPDTIADLLSVMAKNPLDRRFEEYGNFIYSAEGREGFTRFWGNFFSLSHVFNIDTDDPEVIKALTDAIRANQQRPDYLSQQTPGERRRLAEEAYKATLDKRTEARKAEARVVLGLSA